MSRFVQPNFNLTVNIWHNTTLVVDPPDIVTVCNLSPGRLNGSLPIIYAANATPVSTSTVVPPPMYLRLPALTDIRFPTSGLNTAEDLVEVPAGSNRFYMVMYVDDIGKGFPNEHRFADIVMVGGRLLTISGNPWDCSDISFPLA